MSDNRGHDWLDDATAERLLRGAHGDDPAGRAWRDERAAALAGLLSAAAEPAALDPEREEAAVAAFRAARDDRALTADPADVRLGASDDWSPGAGAGGVSRSVRNRTARQTRSLTGSLIATAAVAGVSVAAAAGALPALLGYGVPDPTPVHTQGAATAASDSGSPSPGRTAPPVSSRPGSGSDRPAGGAGGTHGTVVPGRPAGTPSSTAPVTAALDHKALCRAYAAAGRHRKGVDEQAYKQLRTAAGGGGQQQVRRYCAGLLGWNAGDGGNAGNGANGGKARRGDESGGNDSQDGRGRWKNRSGGPHRHGGRAPRGTADGPPALRAGPSVPTSRPAATSRPAPADGRPEPRSGHGSHGTHGTHGSHGTHGE
ncbi:hypothetical protein ACFZAU_07100 [Streptomyces sp. NPDC008238]